MRITRFFPALGLAILSMGMLQAQCDLEGYTYGGAYNGHHYYVSNGNASWPDANAAATALGGYLATISDANENAFVAGIAAALATDPAEFDPGAWIGLNDMDSEGTFVWANGEPVTYTSWGVGEPNNSGNEDWVEINRNGFGLWNDLPAFVDYIEYVVEFDADSDCDGVMDLCDNCDGGDDNGPCDADVFPGLDNIPDAWLCHANGLKVSMCHNGNTICVSYNAVQAHLNHGDFLGPCTGCVEPRSAPVRDASELALFPNPADDLVIVQLGQPLDAATLVVYDKLGRQVMQMDMDGETQIRVSLANCSPGEHYVQIISAETVITRKLMVVR